MKMKIFEEIKEFVDEHWPCHSAVVLAAAAASACSKKYGVSMLEVSANLDRNNKKLFSELIFITQLPEYSNADQYEMLEFLEKKGCLERVAQKI